MSIISNSNHKTGKREIDLSGPQGNAYYLMGQAQKWAKQMVKSPEEITKMLNEMKGGDYENLIKVFDSHFGSICDLVRNDSEEEEDDYEDGYEGEEYYCPEH